MRQQQQIQLLLRKRVVVLISNHSCCLRQYLCGGSVEYGFFQSRNEKKNHYEQPLSLILPYQQQRMMITTTTLHNSSGRLTTASTCLTTAVPNKKNLNQTTTSKFSTTSSNGSIHNHKKSIPPPPPMPTNDGPWLDYNTVKDYGVPVYKLWMNNTFVSTTSVMKTTTTKTNTNTTGVDDGDATSWSSVMNPATGILTAYVPEITNDEFNTVILNAQNAYENWHTTPIQQRQRIMFKYQELLRSNEQRILDLIVNENGKTMIDAKGDLLRGLEVVETACQVSHHVLGQSIQNIDRTNNMNIISVREPLGICVGICPFNFPAMIPLWMFPLAITVGNCFIMKPSEKTPGTMMLLAQLVADAGLPPNVLQVIHGSHETVQRLCEHPKIHSISFVGSNQAGETIHQTVRNAEKQVSLSLSSSLSAESTTPQKLPPSQSYKRIQANLGAKNHAVIMPDCHRVPTLNAVIGAAFGAAGQRCMALSVVVFVTNNNHNATTSSSSQQVQKDEDEVENEWIKDLVQYAKKLRVGPGWDPKSDIGPVITAEAKQRIHNVLDEAVQQGTAKIHLDGRMNDNDDDNNKTDGYYVGPTIVSVSSPDNVAYTTELFGPVLICVTVPTLEDAIQYINNNPYGNGASIFTSNGGNARYFTQRIEAGQLGVNVPIPVPLPMFSFTGNKKSIQGDINFYGPSGVQFYTQLKTITSNWLYDPITTSSSSSNTTSSSNNQHDQNNNNNQKKSDGNDGTTNTSTNSFGGVTMPTLGSS